jgi:Transglutaminase-like superfamily
MRAAASSTVHHTRFTVVAIALVAAVATVFTASVPAAAAQPLFVIPVEQGTVIVDTRLPLRVALETSDPAALERALGGRAVSINADGRVEVVLGGYQTVPAVEARDWVAATFLIDFNDAPVQELVAQLRTIWPQPQRSDIVTFVANTVKGSHDRGMDIASKVARNRVGDCTEFAVLTAALARAAGLPARVVLGVAIVARDGRVEAYGHAWAEIAYGLAWQVADAALASAAGEVRYLPLGVIDDEGPGYAMSVARVMPVWVRRVIVLAPEPPRSGTQVRIETSVNRGDGPVRSTKKALAGSLAQPAAS